MRGSNVGREGARHERRAIEVLRLEQAGQGIGGRELRTVQQRETFLCAEDERPKPRIAQRLLGRHDLAVDQEGADADHRRAHMGERCEIARGADRSLAGHDRRQALGQQRFQQTHRRRLDARRALRQAAELQCHHQAHDRHGHRRADAGGMAEHDVALQGLQVGGLDADARQFSEARIDAVDGLALREDGRDRPRRRLDRLVGGRVEAHRRATIDVAPGRKRNGAGREYDRLHLPLQTRANSGLKPIR